MASYQVRATARTRGEIRRLPGNVRQRVLRQLHEFEEEARPAGSQPLDVSKAGIDLETGLELRRLRLALWRIVYVVDEPADRVTVLAVRQRPPYLYDDLRELLGDL